MNTKLFETVKRIVAEHGESVLDDPKRVSDLLAELASDEPKPQRNAIVKSLEYGFVQELKNTPEEERAECQLRLARQLNEEEGLDLALCGETLELLARELAITEQRKTVCKACGTEIKLSREDIGWLDGLVAKKEAEVARMATEVDEIDRINYEVTEKFEKRKMALIVAIILGVVVFSLYGYSIYDTGRKAPKNFFVVTELDFGNTDFDWNWTNEPGSNLMSTEMRYLFPEITYNSNFDGEVTFFIKIIDPSGEIMSNDEISPDGFTHTSSLQMNSGSGELLRFGGWGNNETSEYPAGVYTVEIWYKDVLLITREVTIHDSEGNQEDL